MDKLESSLSLTCKFWCALSLTEAIKFRTDLQGSHKTIICPVGVLPNKIANIIFTNGALFREVFWPHYKAQATLTLKLVNTM